MGGEGRQRGRCSLLGVSRYPQGFPPVVRPIPQVLKTNRRSDAWRTQVPRLERLMQQFEKGAWTMESALSAFADGIADADASKESSDSVLML